MKHNSKFGPARLGLFTQRLVKPVFKNRGLMEGKIITHWPQIVGEKFAHISFAEKITFPRGKRSEGTLHLNVTSSGALLFQYSQDLILERVNIFFGYKALSKLRMIHGLTLQGEAKIPYPPKILTDEEKAWLEKQMEGVEDIELRVYLEKLGEAICQ
ncbi:MAG: DciA family protein [Alphaproteobacteria bacterium]|nr:DciA family protein [Alphaproteobacteria bacterium]